VKKTLMGGNSVVLSGGPIPDTGAVLGKQGDAEDAI